FLGLSTITSERPRPPLPAPFPDSAAAARGRFGLAAFRAGLFLALVSDDDLELVVDLADLRAPISSDPVIPSRLRSPRPVGGRRREGGFGGVAGCLGDKSW